MAGWLIGVVGLVGWLGWLGWLGWVVWLARTIGFDPQVGSPWGPVDT